jgi:hypothetical protein
MFVCTRETDRRATGLATLVGLVVSVSAVGCSSLDPALDTCGTISIGSTRDPSCPVGAAGRGSGGTTGTNGNGNGPAPMPPTGPQWACLEKPPTSPAPMAPLINMTSVVVDYAESTPLAGLDVVYCLTTNDMCTGMVSRAVPVPDKPPLMNVQMRAGTEGFLRLTAPDHVSQDYYLLGPALVDDSSLAGPTNAFALVSNNSLAGFIADLGTKVQPDLGILAVFIVDCDGNRVPGARLRLPELANKPELETAEYFAINGHLPTLDANTEADGTAGFVNMPLSNVLVEATINGYSFGSARLRVRGTRITAASIRPAYPYGK